MSSEHSALSELRERAPGIFELSTSEHAAPRIRLIADELLLQQIAADRSFAQLSNVTSLPGVVAPVVGLPDMHEGYGFPVGAVAATRVPNGAISPGGIGFDINCGVRLLSSQLSLAQVRPRLEALVHELSRSIPSGYGRAGKLALSDTEIERVLRDGCSYLIGECGHGTPEDLACIEAQGHLSQADPEQVSARAKARGRDQLGTLGGGNHFLEVQYVEAIYDPRAAETMGLHAQGICVLIHTGSRGLGHQVCTDYVQRMDEKLCEYGIELPDRQLACAPLSSPEGSAYFAAMCAAANFAWCNRQMLTERVRQAFKHVFADRAAPELRIVYDVAHNIAKLEQYGSHLLCVHRKGATRALGPGSADLPAIYCGIGQPVFIPGSMGTASFVLLGTELARDLSFSSCCHGAGRALSRGAAKRKVQGRSLRKELSERGIVIRCPSDQELAEEAPLAYKDVDRVVAAVERAGIAKRVARLAPIGVLKG